MFLTTFLQTLMRRIVMDNAKESMDIARKVAEQLKRNGEFDKCRREVMLKVVDSSPMKRSFEDCSRLVKQCLRNAPSNTNISKLRETVKEQIRRKGMIVPLMNCAEYEFRNYESSSKLHEMIEEISRSELDLPSRDSNIELVDMEVSSGASSSSSMSSALSIAHSLSAVNNNKVRSEQKKNLSPSEASTELWPKTPSLIHRADAKPDQPLAEHLTKKTKSSNSRSPVCPVFVSRSPSVISDDSLPACIEKKSANSFSEVLNECIFSASIATEANISKKNKEEERLHVISDHSLESLSSSNEECADEENTKGRHSVAISKHGKK